MRIFCGGIHMEANSFNPILSDEETFRKYFWMEGTGIEALRPTTTEGRGVLDFQDDNRDVEFVYGLYTHAMTSGPIRKEAFERMSGALMQMLKDSGKVDGVLLLLHGACQAEAPDDCEGYIAEQVRSIVGPDIPIVASLDLHACVTGKMVSNLDGAAAYRTFPHTDHAQTGYRAAECLKRIIQDNIRPKKIHKRIPLIMSTSCPTYVQPLLSVMEKYKSLLQTPGVISGALCFAQPWLDTPELGCSFSIFYTDAGDTMALENGMDIILQELWDCRECFYPSQPDIHEAIELCKTLEKPVCLVDFGDVPPAGGTGDSVVPLKALLEAELPFKSCVMLYDPSSAKKAKTIGAGNKGRFYIGTNDGIDFNGRIELEAEVAYVTGEPFRHLGPAQKGALINAGTRALLRTGNVYIIVCENVCMTHDRNMLITMGLDPASLGIVVQKSTQSYKPNWQGVMRAEIYADTPGYSRQNPAHYTFKKASRPLYPLDDI